MANPEKNPCGLLSAGVTPPPRDLPGSPHGPGVGPGGHAQGLSVLRGLGGALVVLAVGLVQVGAEVLAGRAGGRGRAAAQAPSSGRGRARAHRLVAPVPGAAGAPGSVSDQVHQHVLEVVLVQGHALQEVVEELRRHRGVDAGTAGHERVDLVHALDVARREPLAGFSAQCVRFCGRKEGGKDCETMFQLSPVTFSKVPRMSNQIKRIV